MNTDTESQKDLNRSTQRERSFEGTLSGAEVAKALANFLVMRDNEPYQGPAKVTWRIFEDGTALVTVEPGPISVDSVSSCKTLK